MSLENQASTRIQRFCMTFATSMSFFLTGMDTMVANVALPTIARELGGTVAEQAWVIDAYTIMFATLLLLAGNISDHLGAKRIFCYGTTVFMAASLVCSFANSMMVLIIGRALLGVGAAMILPSSMAVIKESTPDAASRARALGIWSAGGAVSVAIGPIVGGLLTPIHWSLVFSINIPFCIAALLATTKLPESTRHPTSFDVVGQILGSSSIGIFIFGVIASGQQGFSPMVLAALIGGVLLIALFLIAEGKVAHPMMPLSLLSPRGMRIAIVTATLQIFNWYGMVFITTMFLQQVMGMSPLVSGLVYIPASVFGMIGNLFSTRPIRLFGFEKTAAIGTALMFLGFVVAALSIAQTSLFILAFGLVVVSIGASITTPALAGITLQTVGDELSGIASAIYNTFRQVGGAIGVAVYGALVPLASLTVVASWVQIAAAALMVVAFVYIVWQIKISGNKAIVK